jgi:hypothetical protein
MNAPGREIEGPMAVVLLGGLLTSMVLNLMILPTLALRYGRFHEGKADDELLGFPGSDAEHPVQRSLEFGDDRAATFASHGKYCQCPGNLCAD